MPSSQKRLLRQQAVRQTILDAAKDIIVKDGWQDLTIRKICQQVNFSAPIIYKIFESKDHILQALRIDGKELLLQRIKQIHETEKDAPKQLIIYGMASWYFAIENPELYQVMVNIQGALTNSNESASPVTEINNLYKITIKTINEKASRDEKELLLLLDYYTAIVHGFIALTTVKKLKSDHDAPEKVFRNCLKHFVCSITTNQ